jgi:hypothetical protein
MTVGNAVDEIVKVDGKPHAVSVCRHWLKFAQQVPMSIPRCRK